MTRLVAAGLSCLLCSVVALQLEQPPSPQACSKLPAFMIGGHPDYLGGETNAYHPTSVSKEQMVDMLHDTNGPQPEVAVVIVGPPADASINQDSFPNLKRFIVEAQSSKVLPCLVRSDRMSVMGYISQNQGSQHRPQVVEYADLEYYLSSRAELLPNGKMEVVVTSLPDDALAHEVDHYLSQVHLQLSSSVPSGRFLLHYTPEHHRDQPIYKPAPVFHRRLDPTYVDPSGWPYNTQYLYATPNLVAGLLTGLFLIVTTWIGATALFSLQGPSKWVSTKLPDGKEF